MNSFDKSITIVLSVFIVMFFSFLISLSLTNAYVNSPTNFTTSHYMELNTDNNTRDSLEHMSDINNIDCEIRLLNQTLQHQKEISVRDAYILNLTMSR